MKIENFKLKNSKKTKIILGTIAVTTLLGGGVYIK